MRVGFLCVLAFVAGPDSVRAADPATHARAALALAKPPAPPACNHRSRAALVLAETAEAAPACHCHATGQCPCPEGDCPCCGEGLPSVNSQMPRARQLLRPLVAYYGCSGSCCDGAISGQSPTPPEGVASGVVVWLPLADGRWKIVERLPADAKREQVLAAVRRANEPAREPLELFPGGCATGGCNR